MTWPLVKLGEVCDVVSGATPKTGNSKFWDGDVPWVTPKDLSGIVHKLISDSQRKITHAGLKNCSARMLPSQSVLFSSRAPIGLVAINSIPVCTNQGFKSFVPHDGRIFADYLYWWLLVHRDRLQRLGRGATFKEVSKKIVEAIQIPLPPLAEQKRIAAILDAADALRAKRRESLAQLDTLLQSTFLDMFGDPVTNPMGWDVFGVEEICEQVVDCVNRTAPIVEYRTDYKMIRTTNIRHGVVDTVSVRYVEREIYDKWNRRLVPCEGDVLLTREAPVGEAGILRGSDQVFLGQRIMLYRSNPLKVTPEYLLFAFMGEGLQRQFNRNGSGSTVKHLPLPACRNFRIITPPIYLQHRFAAIVESVERQKARMRAHLAELDTLFASLQFRAFNGEL